MTKTNIRSFLENALDRVWSEYRIRRFKHYNTVAAPKPVPRAPMPSLPPDPLAWSDAGFGPNSIDVGEVLQSRPVLKLDKPFVIDPRVAHTFNAYASAAYPLEIGGLLRIEESEDEIRAIDVHIFPHTAASGGYFELDGAELSKWMLDMVKDGRGEEISQWRSLVHSHPGMAPFLSGTDEQNIFKLAGDDYAYSVICSATRDNSANYFAVHYAQTTPTRMLLKYIEVQTDPGSVCGGTSSLSGEEVEAIAEDAKEKLPTPRHGTYSRGHAFGFDPALPWRGGPTSPFDGNNFARRS